MQTLASTRPTLRKHPMQSSTLLPIISLSSFADCKDKLTRMTSSASPPPCPTIDTKPITTKSTRPPGTPKSPFHHPRIVSQAIFRADQSQSFCLMNSPMSSNPAGPAASPKRGPTTIHSTQQQLLIPRSHPQFGRFLTYLRLQSLARMKRKQQQREGKPNDPLEAMLVVNYSRHTSQIFQSISNLTLDALPTDYSPMPTSKTRGQSLSPVRPLQRSTSNLIGNSRRPSVTKPSFFPTPPRTPTEDRTCLSTPSSLLNTPRNSLADESIVLPATGSPYEVQLTDDVFHQASRRQPQFSSTNLEFKYRYE